MGPKLCISPELQGDASAADVGPCTLKSKAAEHSGDAKDHFLLIIIVVGHLFIVTTKVYFCN